MSAPLTLGKYSFGIGDRFAHQAKAQLRACMLAAENGAAVVPVWNKSYREHTTVGSAPASIRTAADAAVKDLGWSQPYHVDADHIRLETVDQFIPHSDFFTLDVADQIGQPADPAAVHGFLDRHHELVGEIAIPGIKRPFESSRTEVERVAAKYLAAVLAAGKIYRHSCDRRKAGN